MILSIILYRRIRGYNQPHKNFPLKIVFEPAQNVDMNAKVE